MRIQPHLTFAGDCEAAFRLYERVFGGSLYVMTYGASPSANDVSAAWRDKVVHATLALPDGNALLGADVEQFERPQGFYVFAALRDAGEARRVFDALADGGSVKLPLQKTFWSPSLRRRRRSLRHAVGDHGRVGQRDLRIRLGATPVSDIR